MELAKAVAATFAVVGQEMPDIGLATIVSELQEYPLGDVLKALARCRKELRKITLADIIDRIPSGHPGIEEAWAEYYAEHGEAPASGDLAPAGEVPADAEAAAPAEPAATDEPSGEV